MTQEDKELLLKDLCAINSDRWMSLEDLPNEKWKVIEGYENRYSVSNYGRVKTNSLTYYIHGHLKTKEAHILKTIIRKDGYCKVNLGRSGKQKTLNLHRLVAMAFILNPNDLPCINHKDENPSNNIVDNLEWCTPSYNVQHAWDTGLATTAEKPVVCLDTGVVYKSARYAADTLNYKSPSAITACCLGKRKSAYKGWRWKYYQPNEITRLLIEIGFNKYPKDDSEEEFTCYLALASKFLREEKNIIVEVFVDDDSDTPITYNIYKDGECVCHHHGKYWSVEEWSEALLEGIKEAVKILKEK